VDRRTFLRAGAALGALTAFKTPAALKPTTMKTAYISHAACLRHEMTANHPERPARMQAIEQALQRAGLFSKLAQYEAPLASKAVLARAHTNAYIDWIFSQSPKTGLVQLDADTAMNAHSLEATLRASGAAVKGVDLVMTGQMQVAFCNTRPPGHHAGRASSAGFCIFNHVAAAALHAIAQYGLTRVAIADFDVHHGNGTEDIFHDDPRVMLCSSFRHPYYPYSGADSGNDHIINTPLAAGSDGKALRKVVNEQWLPALARFKPQLLIISAGFDAHQEDSMGGLKWLEEDYVWVTEALKAVAKQHAEGRIVSVLEGGYALDALGRSAAAHLNTLIAAS